MYQSSHFARMATESRGKFICSFLIFFFAPSLIITGIVQLAISDDEFSVLGTVFLLIGLGLFALAIALCYRMRKDAIKSEAEQPQIIPGQPVVSGTAPPGAIRGHFLVAQSQPDHNTERLMDPAPDYTPPYHQAPPSYSEVAAKM